MSLIVEKEAYVIRDVVFEVYNRDGYGFLEASVLSVTSVVINRRV
ncbi:MAG: hypothetical protein ACQETR_04870 [Thermodesulfobacteriota bacterium]